MHDVERIKTLREQRGLSQSEASKLAGISVQQWNNVESGRVGGKKGVALATLDKMAKALGVKARDLLK